MSVYSGASHIKFHQLVHPRKSQVTMKSACEHKPTLRAVAQGCTVFRYSGRVVASWVSCLATLSMSDAGVHANLLRTRAYSHDYSTSCCSIQDVFHSLTVWRGLGTFV